MPPPSLQLEFLPRRRRPWVSVAVTTVALLAAGAFAAWAWSQQMALGQLQRQVDAAQGPAAPGLSRSAPQPAMPWQTAAQQDQRLFSLPLEARLLEIERCTDDRTVATRLVHDANADATQLELKVSDAARLPELVECLNTSDERGHPWRLVTVEAVGTALPGGGPVAQQRVVLKR